MKAITENPYIIIGSQEFKINEAIKDLTKLLENITDPFTIGFIEGILMDLKSE